jgi:hypothetical protein
MDETTTVSMHDFFPIGDKIFHEKQDYWKKD